MEIGKTAKWLTVKLAHQVEILAASQTAKPLYCWPVPSTNPQAQGSQVTNLVRTANSCDTKLFKHVALIPKKTCFWVTVEMTDFVLQFQVVTC
jgi:hypothetical protein